MANPIHVLLIADKCKTIKDFVHYLPLQYSPHQKSISIRMMYVYLDRKVWQQSFIKEVKSLEAALATAQQKFVSNKKIQIHPFPPCTNEEKEDFKEICNKVGIILCASQYIERTLELNPSSLAELLLYTEENNIKNLKIHKNVDGIVQKVADKLFHYKNKHDIDSKDCSTNNSLEGLVNSLI